MGNSFQKPVIAVLNALFIISACTCSETETMPSGTALDNTDATQEIESDLFSSNLSSSMKATTASYGKERFSDWCEAGEYREFEPVVPTFEADCHTQGLSAGLNEVAVACNGDNQSWLHIFKLSPNKQSLTYMQHRTFGNYIYSHPNVGNAFLSSRYLSGGNIQHTPLYPIVIAGTGDYAAAPAELQMINRETQEVACTHTHDSLDDNNRGHLGAVSAVAVNEIIYVAACGWSCDQLYIYRLSTPYNNGGSCGAELTAVLRARGSSADTTPIKNAGAGDNNWGYYNGISILADTDHIFMIGTYEKYMDTWRIDNFSSSNPIFLKLAKFTWDGTWKEDGQYYFKQGVSVELVGDSRIAIWLSPHNYRSVHSSSQSVRIYRCEREIGQYSN